MRQYLPIVVALGVSPAALVAAQDLPLGGLPTCDATAPQSFPCVTPYDKPPGLLDAARPPGTGPRKTPRVWVYVSDSGVVKATQIARGAGLDFDIAAIAIAQQLRFTPARLGDHAVAVWFVVPIETEAAPTPCSIMAVPLSAGWAMFADSERLERPELGMLYRYRGVEWVEGLRLDVFIYPKTDWPSLEEQAQAFRQSLEVMQRRGDFSSYDVLGTDDAKVKARDARLGREITIPGRVVRVKLRAPSGEEFESYFSVFSEEQKYVKFRVTHAFGRRVQSVLDDFVKQVLEARAAEPARCRGD